MVIFNPSRQKPRIVCIWIKSSVRHNILFNGNGILIVFYQYFTILSTK